MKISGVSKELKSVSAIVRFDRSDYDKRAGRELDPRRHETYELKKDGGRVRAVSRKVETEDRWGGRNGPTE